MKMKAERFEDALPTARADPGPAVGEALADRRRALGYSVEDIALKLKFSRRQLEALEQGRFDRLSGPTFVRGMTRSYARLLDLDPAPLIERIGAHLSAPADPETAIVLNEPIPFSDGSQRVNLAYAGLSLVIAGVIGAVAWEWLAESAAKDRLTFVRAAQAPAEPARVPVEVAGTTLAVMEPPAPAQETAVATVTEGLRARGGMRRIALDFDRESWVQIRARDGRVLLSQLNAAGTQQVVEGRPPFDLVIGNAQHVRLRYDDHAVDLAPHLKIDVARLTLE